MREEPCGLVGALGLQNLLVERLSQCSAESAIDQRQSCRNGTTSCVCARCSQSALYPFATRPVA